MKKITLEQAIKILENCVAVIIDSNALVYPSIDTIGYDDPDTEFLYLKWEEEGLEFNTQFNSDHNQSPYINDNAELVLIDTEGEEVKLTILGKMYNFDV